MRLRNQYRGPFVSSRLSTFCWRRRKRNEHVLLSLLLTSSVCTVLHGNASSPVQRNDTWSNILLLDVYDTTFMSGSTHRCAPSCPDSENGMGGGSCGRVDLYNDDVTRFGLGQRYTYKHTKTHARERSLTVITASDGTVASRTHISHRTLKVTQNHCTAQLPQRATERKTILCARACVRRVRVCACACVLCQCPRVRVCACTRAV